MDGIILKPFAKINLGLDIIGRRENGYHEVKMVMQSIDLKDSMKMFVLDDDVVTMKCNLDYLPTDDNNIVVKAVKLVRREYGINKGVRIELEKNIPIAAGMAGGSSNAAAALHGMSELFDLKLNTEELCKLGVKLGADVPYCIMGGTMLAEGIGEVLTPLKKAPDCYVTIVKPSFAVSTKAVYEAYDKLNDNEIVHPDIDGIIKAINEGDLYKMCALMGNTLESVTEVEYPYIKEIKSTLIKNGAINALMSGSGPTVFGIFDNLATANQAISCIEDSDMIEKKTVVELYK